MVIINIVSLSQSIFWISLSALQSFFFEIKTWCNKTPNQSLYLFFAFTQAFNDRQSYNPYLSQPYIKTIQVSPDNHGPWWSTFENEPYFDQTLKCFYLMNCFFKCLWNTFLSLMLNNESWLIEPKGKVKNFYDPRFLRSTSTSCDTDLEKNTL